MAKQQPELGLRSPFKMRLGVDIATFKGLNKEADPGAIADEEFQTIENAYILANGEVTIRGGQTAINTDAMSGCIDAIIDDELPGTQQGRLFWDKRGTTLNTIILRAYTAGAASEVTAGDNIGTAEIGYLVEFEGDMLVATDNDMYHVDPATGVGTLLFSSGAVSLRTPTVHDLKLWFISDVVNVSTWDGTDVVAAGVGLGGLETRLFRHAGEIWYCSTLALKRYDGGAWTAVALPGSLTQFTLLDAVTLGSVTYLLGQDTNGLGDYDYVILSLTGYTVAVARTVLANQPVSGGIGCGVVSGTTMYFAYPNAAGAATLGSYDGTTWTNSLRVVGLDVSASVPQTVLRMAVFDTRLYLSGLMGQNNIIRSPANITGAWAEFDDRDQPPGNSFLVFEG